MARYRVTSNAATGFDGVFRGYPECPEPWDPKAGRPLYEAGFGWFWPSKGITVEVVDQDADPEQEKKALEDAGVERIIGKRTWKALQDDPRIFAGPINMVDGDQSSAALTAANDRIAELERQLAAAKGEAPPDAAADQPKGKGKK